MVELLKLTDIKVVKSRKKILEIADFTVYEGDRVAIIGPNGAGKSTLLKVLAFLEEPSEGNRYFKNSKVGSETQRLQIRRKMAAVFQNPLLLNMSVYDNVALGLRFRGVDPINIEKKVEYWLKKLGIWNLRSQNALELSGGEAQRVSISRALCLEPDILFLDEPFSYLDAPTREKLLVELHSIVEEQKITTVFVTHDFTEIPYLANKACVLMKGVIVQKGLPEDILCKPISLEIAKFIGVENIFEGRVVTSHKGLCKVQVGSLIFRAKGEFKAHQRVNICIRSQGISLTNTESGSNVFKGKLQEVFYKGDYKKCLVDIGIPVKVSTTQDVFEGQDVIITIPENKIHVLKQKG